MKSFIYWATALVAVFSAAVQAEPAAVPDPDWKVARAQFTSAIENREPVDRVVVLSPPADEVYFFTDLRQLQDRTVTHRWEYQGQLISKKSFNVGGARWRVYSKVRLQPDQQGEWSVTVVDESGWPLYTELFRYESLSKDTTAVSVQQPAVSE